MPRTTRKQAPRIGRPPLPEGERKAARIELRATGDEVERLDELAAAWETDRSGAVRRAVDEAHTRATKASTRKGRG